MELQHFSHEHPLIFSEERSNDGEEIVCTGCEQKISRYAYRCRDCSFFLHKLCAELPREMKHPMHSKHSLTLLPQAPYGSSEFECDACDEASKGFTYHCFPCEFDLDMSCAMRAHSVEHKSHNHALIPLFSSASLECHGCRTTHEDVFYACKTCKFWIHEGCASLPTTIKHSSHVHPLALDNAYVWFEYRKCRICKEHGNRRCWAYRCQICDYYVHMNCTRYPFTEKRAAIKVENLDWTNLIHLPAPDESFSLIAQFVTQINLGDNKRELPNQLISHFCHNHPLTLFNSHSDDSLGSGSKLSNASNEQKKQDDKICNACALPIISTTTATTFYSCRVCSDLFLHKWCAELPTELQHPCHPHPLKVCLEPRPFFCRGCCLYCNSTFSFHCELCLGYRLDANCASLPRSIVHEVHEHPLLLRENCVDEGCAACDQRQSTFAFGCDYCSFNLHYECALLPCKVTHRYDEHPFILTYAPPIKDGTDAEYYCEFCEEQMDTKWWFYHCVDCDQSACANCIRKEKKLFPRLNSGKTYNCYSHPHPLTLVEGTLCSCDCCHRRIYGYAFKCATCGTTFHGRCVELTSHCAIPTSAWY